MFIIAKRDFSANNLDVKEGTLFWVEKEEGVMVNKQFFCSVDSPNFSSYFEIIS